MGTVYHTHRHFAVCPKLTKLSMLGFQGNSTILVDSLVSTSSASNAQKTLENNPFMNEIQLYRAKWVHVS